MRNTGLVLIGTILLSSIALADAPKLSLLGGKYNCMNPSESDGFMEVTIDAEKSRISVKNGKTVHEEGPMSLNYDILTAMQKEIGMTAYSLADDSGKNLSNAIFFRLSSGKVLIREISRPESVSNEWILPKFDPDWVCTPNAQ